MTSSPGQEINNHLPCVSVVIPCRNERDFILPCLQSLLSQSPGVTFEVIVADGMSSDGTREILETFRESDSRIRVIDNPRQIASTALNAATACARGDIIVRIDVHTAYPHDYLMRCVESVRCGDAWTVGGPQVAASESALGRAIAAAYQSPFAVGGAKCHFAEYEGPVDHVYLGCWQRRAFNRVGGFDTALIRNQDVELDLRVADAGGGLWQSPNIQCRYQVRRSLQALTRQNIQFGYWKVQVAQRHPMQLKLRHLIPALFIATVACLSFASLFLPAAAVLLVAIVSIYACFVALGTIVIGIRGSAALAAFIPIVLPCYHLGYGYGFLRGVWAYTVGRVEVTDGFRQLTR